VERQPLGKSVSSDGDSRSDLQLGYQLYLFAGIGKKPQNQEGGLQGSDIQGLSADLLEAARRRNLSANSLAAYERTWTRFLAWAAALNFDPRSLPSGLTKEEVDKMQREAESHAEEDRKAKEAIELRNNADNLAYQCEKQLKDLGDKLDEATKKSVEDAVAKVREALKCNDNDAVKRVRSMTSRPNSKRSVRSSTRRPPRRLVPSAAPQKVPPLEPKARRRTQMS
jgi:hypothetical protein